MNKKIVYVTSQSPFGNGEIWAIREMNSLIDTGTDLVIVPRTGSGKILHKAAHNLLNRTIAIPYINTAIFFVLLKKIVTQPYDFYSIVRWIFSQSTSLKDLLKGLVVLPKSIYIGNKLKGKGVEYIHAFSATSVATVAYILSHELKIPWSVTFHSSWGITESNRRKFVILFKSVDFVRVISNQVSCFFQEYFANEFISKIKVVHIGVSCNQ